MSDLYGGGGGAWNPSPFINVDDLKYQTQKKNC